MSRAAEKWEVKSPPGGHLWRRVDPERGGSGRSPRSPADQVGHPFELLLGIEVDDDLAAVPALHADQDRRAEARVEVLLELEDVGGLPSPGGRAGIGRVLADPGARRRRLAAG